MKKIRVGWDEGGAESAPSSIQSSIDRRREHIHRDRFFPGTLLGQETHRVSLYQTSFCPTRTTTWTPASHVTSSESRTVHQRDVLQ